MKKFWAVVVAITVAVGWFLFFKSQPEAPQTSPAATATVSETNPTATGNSGNIAAALPAGAKATDDIAAHAGSPNPAPPVVAMQSLPPLTVLDNARVAIHNFNATFGENPVGTNPEITAALTGKNPKQINFITAESGLRVNENGEMVDAWGTPLFFHQLSGQEMEIRSAGEDRKMWTFDDQVTR